ncbi:MAG: hypothetical protein ACPGIC_04475 [Opitutales bacterium]
MANPGLPEFTGAALGAIQKHRPVSLPAAWHGRRDSFRGREADKTGRNANRTTAGEVDPNLGQVAVIV